MRPNRPRSWTFWTHKTQQSVPKWYHGGRGFGSGAGFEPTTSGLRDLMTPLPEPGSCLARLPTCPVLSSVALRLMPALGKAPR